MKNSIEERVRNLISQLTLEEKIKLLPTRQEGIPRLGISEFYIGGEAAHGIAWLGRATVFPQPIGLSSSFDRNLMRRIGEVVATEARAYYYMRGKIGGLMLWAPTVDMERDPRWGRTEEGYGEDPFLAGEMASAYIQGLQGDDPIYLKTAMTPKHFFANNNEKDRDKFSANIDPRNMYEYYLDVFRRVIEKGKAPCIMTAYNAVNGVPCIINPIVKEIVKEKFGLSGCVVTDAGDFSQTVTSHHIFKNHYETIVYALRAGIDAFTDDPQLVISSAWKALELGLITEEDINKAISNTLKVRFRLGEFDEEVNKKFYISPTKICDEKHSKLAYEAALKSIVLLKNNNKFLPLRKEKIKRIAVLGPLANKNYNDWYSGTYPYKVSILQGIVNKLYEKEIFYHDSYDLVAIKSVKNNKYLRVLESNISPVWAISDNITEKEIFKYIDWGWGNKSLQSVANNKFLTCDESTLRILSSSEEVFGWFVKELFNIDSLGDGTFVIRTWNGKYLYLDEKEGNVIKFKDNLEDLPEEKFIIEKLENGIEKSSSIAQNSDLVILCVGNNPLVNGREEIDRVDIVLPDHQEKLIKEIYKVNPNVVLLVISSYPYAITWAKEHIPAIIWSSHGGQEMGNAIADVLVGEYSPSGRLNMTWYKSINDLTSITDYDIIRGKRTYMYFDKEPLFPFGHGLTYTEFSYKNLKLDSHNYKINEEIKISFEIENIGEMDSDEVPQVYVKALNSKLKRPKLQLKAFERIFIPKGEKVEVKMSIPVSELFIWDVRGEKYLVEKGEYEILVGSSSEDIKLKGRVYVNGEELCRRNPLDKNKAFNFDDCWDVSFNTKENFRETYVIFNNENSYILFQDLEFIEPSSKITIELCSSQKSKIVLYFSKIDKEFSFEVIDTSNSWKEFSFLLGESLIGMQDMYIKGGKELKINWFKFE
ncbi:MAG: glycoside hydrolase family 3 C-terminal domain-containing protein [Dictyoglomaceae bacterium]